MQQGERVFREGSEVPDCLSLLPAPCVSSMLDAPRLGGGPCPVACPEVLTGSTGTLACPGHIPGFTEGSSWCQKHLESLPWAEFELCAIGNGAVSCRMGSWWVLPLPRWPHCPKGAPSSSGVDRKLARAEVLSPQRRLLWEGAGGGPGRPIASLAFGPGEPHAPMTPQGRLGAMVTPGPPWGGDEWSGWGPSTRSQARKSQLCFLTGDATTSGFTQELQIPAPPKENRLLGKDAPLAWRPTKSPEARNSSCPPRPRAPDGVWTPSGAHARVPPAFPQRGRWRERGGLCPLCPVPPQPCGNALPLGSASPVQTLPLTHAHLEHAGLAAAGPAQLLGAACAEARPARC